MQGQDAFPYLRETLLFLALSGILIPLLQRLRINQVLGFLAAGALLGPHGLASWAAQSPGLAALFSHVSIARPEGVAALGDIGVLFLMFMIGLELSAERLWSLRHWVFGAGTAQVAVSALVIGGLAWWFGNRIDTSIVLGFVLSLSSTAVVMQLLSGRHALGSALRQPAFSILMLQDLAVVPVFILMGVLASGKGESLWPALGQAFARSVAVVLLIYLAGRRLIRPLFASFLRQRQPEVFMALTLLCALGIAAATAAAGLSMALGAFLAGLLLSETEFRHEVEVTMEPFKGLLMGLFFMSVGMQTDVREIAQSPLWIPLSLIGLFGIKAAVLAAIFRIGGFNWGHAVAGGLLLGQGGEFAFIVIGQAVAMGMMDAAVGQFMMLVVGSSLFLTPLAARAGVLFAGWWERRRPPQAASPDRMSGETLPPAEGRVIIAGFGRVGQLLARILAEQDLPYVALENDARLVASLHPQGFPVYFGAASRAELLHKLRADSAAAIVLTMDHPASALHAAKAIRREFPQLPLYARSRDEKHALELRQAGATMVVPETLESGLQLSGFVLQAMGISEAGTTRLLQAERERRIAEWQAEAGKPDG